MGKFKLTTCDERDLATLPSLVEGDAPIYPIENLLEGKKGIAIVRLTVDPSGSTSDVKAATEQDRYFANHAVIAVRKWRFEAATRGGQPVTVHCSVAFHYGGSQ